MCPGDFEQTISQCRARLIKVAENVVGPTAAEDVVQDALLSVFENARWREIPAAEIPLWLTAAVGNAAKDHLKAASRRSEHEANFAVRRAPVLSFDDVLTRLDLEAALGQLSAEVREAVIAVAVRGDSVREHAADAGVTKSTADRRVAAGLAFLRERGTNAAAASLHVPEPNDEEAA